MKQCSLKQKISNKSTTIALLSAFLKRLAKDKKYLGIWITNLVLLKTHHRLLKKQSIKPTAFFIPINMAPAIAKLIIKLMATSKILIKQIRCQFTRFTNIKRIKKFLTFFLLNSAQFSSLIIY